MREEGAGTQVRKAACGAGKRRNLSLDIVKLILSVMIVFLHTGPNSFFRWQIMMPLLRLAVPLFFLISSYLFFSSLRRCTSAQEHRGRLFRFIKRSSLLYLFWFLIFLQPMIEYRQWFSEGFTPGISALIRDLFLGSTFVASWFLMALILAVPLVYVLRSMLPGAAVVALCVPFFVMTTIASDYQTSTLLPFIERLDALVPYSYNSFLIALMWVALGAYISDKLADKSYQKHFMTRSSWLLVLGVFIGIAALYVEVRFTKRMDWEYSGDSYFMLLPACLCIFLLLLKHPCYLGGSHSAESAAPLRLLPFVEFIQHAPVVSFCVHYNILVALEQHGFFISDNLLHGFMPFVVSLGLSWLTALLLMYLQKLPGLSWLKVAS